MTVSRAQAVSRSQSSSSSSSKWSWLSLETFLIVAGLTLFVQLFPGVLSSVAGLVSDVWSVPASYVAWFFRGVIYTLDVRNWTWVYYVVAQVLILLSLCVYQMYRNRDA